MSAPPLAPPDPRKKSRPLGPASSSWPAGLARPRRQSRIRAYLGDGDVGCRARGAPTSSRARVEACGSCVARADWVHATPLTEALHVPLHLERSCCAAPAGRSVAQAHASPGPTARGAFMATALLGWAQRFGTGTATSPRRHQSESCWRRPHPCPPRSRQFCSACSAHASLRREPGFLAESAASDAHWSGAGGVPSTCRLGLQPLRPTFPNNVR